MCTGPKDITGITVVMNTEDGEVLIFIEQSPS